MAKRCSRPWSRRWGAARGRPRRVGACGPSTIRASRCSPGRESGKPLTPIVVCRTKLVGGSRALGEQRTRSAGSAACRSTPTSQRPSWPGCWSETRGWGRRERRALCGWARSTPSCATASGPASRPTRRPPRALNSTRWGGRGSIPGWPSCSACRSTCCPRCATPRRARRAAHESWPVELPLAAGGRSAGGSRGRGLRGPRRVKATYGTGVFVLGHVGDEVPEPAGGLCRPWRGRSMVGSSTQSTAACSAAGAMLEVDVPRAGAGGAAGRSRRARSRGRRQRGGPSAPGAGRRGAPWWKPDARACWPGCTEAPRAARGPRRVEGIAWRVATWWPRCRRPSTWHSLRVDGGLTMSRLTAAAQPTRAECRSRPRAPTQRCWAPRRWQRWARARSARWPRRRSACRWTGGVEPARGRSWRAAEHSRWREFVAAAAELR